MTAEKNIEDKLEELGQAIGSDESLVENVMSRIDAKPIAESNRTDKSKNKLLLRRFVMNRLKARRRSGDNHRCAYRHTSLQGFC